MYSLEFTYRFEAAHRFTKGTSKCTTPHGHTWQATLGFESSASQLNSADMIEEFEQLKSAWRIFLRETVDHSFLHHWQDPLRPYLLETIQGFRGLAFPGDPTTELVAALFLEKAIHMTPRLSCKPAFVVVQETTTNCLRLQREGLGDIQQALDLNKKFSGWWQDQDPYSRKFEQKPS